MAQLILLSVVSQMAMESVRTACVRSVEKADWAYMWVRRGVGDQGSGISASFAKTLIHEVHEEHQGRTSDFAPIRVLRGSYLQPKMTPGTASSKIARQSVGGAVVTVAVAWPAPCVP